MWPLQKLFECKYGKNRKMKRSGFTYFVELKINGSEKKTKKCC